ncbi:MAG: LysR family transcriptional regulator [Syntrophobacteraceae bacterium]|jgi:DNA-binding transcriptional LysR family regulator|nr:LysR family transcriptional regulator [Syntrophobacteraceae bacterium]
MEWQQIMGFYQVARLGSFTRAAEATLRTQSALSQQVRALELELDCRLLERSGARGLKLTPAGERFLEFCGSVLRGERKLREDLHELRGLHKGPLRIAAPFTTLYHLFPERIEVYAERFPHVELTLLDRPQKGVLRLVREGEVDLGVAGESSVPPDLASIRWKPVETVLMVPHDHPLVGHARVTWKQIASYPLILPPRDQAHSGRAVLEEQMGKLGLRCRVVMESSNVELSARYVEIGLGISLATVVRDLPVLRGRQLLFLPLGHYFKADHVALVTRKDKVMAPYQTAFMKLLLGDLDTEGPLSAGAPPGHEER